MLLLHKQPHDKRSITESLQAYITRARLSVRWVYFQEKYYNSQNYAYPPPPLKSHLSLLFMGVFSKDYNVMITFQ